MEVLEKMLGVLELVVLGILLILHQTKVVMVEMVL